MNNPLDKAWVPWSLSGCGCVSLFGFIAIASVALSVSSGDPAAGGNGGGGSVVRSVTAQVQAVEGRVPVAVGSPCAFNVERHPHPQGYWCRAQVVCANILVYGGQNAGYFPCQWSDESPPSIVGADLNTTAQDTDAALGLNTNTRTLLVEDDEQGSFGRFRLQAQITGFQ